MNIGDKCICQEDEWYNAFGDTTEMLKAGMRLRIVGSRRIGGCDFFEFEGHEGNYFLSHGFKPLRGLN